MNRWEKVIFTRLYLMPPEAIINSFRFENHNIRKNIFQKDMEKMML